MYWKLRRRTVRSRGLRFTLQCDNWITRYRCRSYNCKEPETLDWIDHDVHDGDVLFDVGANIGVYTVYAALRHPNLRVIAFEPEYANLHLLRDNVIHNHLSDRVMIYGLALSNHSGLSMLHIQDHTPGAALSTESVQSITATLSGNPVIAREGIYALRMDEFCQQAGVTPNAVKLDVDGTEAAVLAGGADVMKKVRTVLLEMPDNLLSRQNCQSMLEMAGLRRTWQDAAVTSNEVWNQRQSVWVNQYRTYASVHI